MNNNPDNIQQDEDGGADEIVLQPADFGGSLNQ